MSQKKRRAYSPEFKDEVVQMVQANSRKVAPVARDLGINSQTLRNWVNAYRDKYPDAEPPLSLNERARLRELERENIELRERPGFWEKQPPSLLASVSSLEVRVC